MSAASRASAAVIVAALVAGRAASAQVDCGPRNFGRPTADQRDCACNGPTYTRVVRDGSPTCRPATDPPATTPSSTQSESRVTAAGTPAHRQPERRPVGRIARGAQASTIAWLRVPGGDFTMSEGEWAHPVRLSGFEMMRAPATVAQYAGCEDAGRCAQAFDDRPGYCNGRQADRAEHPVNCVSWAQASSFCAWAGGRLPTEAEWEFAARGTDGRIRTWGSAEPGNQLCWSTPRERSGTCPVGAFPLGASPFGLLDMLGNVRQWTSDWYGTDPPPREVSVNPTGPASGPTRVIRGFGWSGTSVTSMTATNRIGNPAQNGDPELGLRCVRGARPTSPDPRP